MVLKNDFQTANAPLASAIQALKKIYGDNFSVQDVAGIKKYTGKSGTDVYAVRSTEGEFILRIRSPETAAFGDFLIEVQSALSKAGIHTPPPIINFHRDDRSSIFIEHKSEGEHPKYLTQTEAVELARCIAISHATLQKLVEEKPDLLKSMGFTSRLYDTRPPDPLQKAKLAVSYAAAAATNPRVLGEHTRHYLHGMDETGLRKGIVHHDIHLGNIILNNGKPTLIDWDDLNYATYVKDVTNALMHCVFLPAAERGEKVPANMANAFLREYQKTFPLTPEEVMAVPMMLRNQMAVYLNKELAREPKTLLRRNKLVEEYIGQTDFAALLDVPKATVGNSGAARG